jgi:outer membrane protein OmpA-like peptidoglycan-associated protein
MSQIKHFIFSAISFCFAALIMTALFIYWLPDYLNSSLKSNSPAPVLTHDTLITTDTIFSTKPQSSLASIEFSINSTSPSVIQVNRLKQIITNNFEKKRVFIVDGFADSSGYSNADNNYIAFARAWSIYNLLVKFGISKEDIFVRSFGSQLASLSTNISQRRVDISIAEAP